MSGKTSSSGTRCRGDDRLGSHRCSGRAGGELPTSHGPRRSRTEGVWGGALPHEVEARGGCGGGGTAALAGSHMNPFATAGAASDAMRTRRRLSRKGMATRLARGWLAAATRGPPSGASPARCARGSRLPAHSSAAAPLSLSAHLQITFLGGLGRRHPPFFLLFLPTLGHSLGRPSGCHGVTGGESVRLVFILSELFVSSRNKTASICSPGPAHTGG